MDSADLPRARELLVQVDRLDEEAVALQNPATQCRHHHDLRRLAAAFI